MLLGIIMRLLPKDKQLLLKLAMSITASLDTAKEREKVAEYAMAMMKSGKISVTDWSRLGGMLGILTGRH